VQIEETVIQKLKNSNSVLCTVESCTGGLISHLLTNISGSSAVFWGGYVVYDNTLKEALGTPSTVIQNHGAVSAEVARALAEKGLERMRAILEQGASYSLVKPVQFGCIATTGIAGPLGGSEKKPVGLCYIALALSNRDTIVEKFQTASLDRLQNKTAFAQEALQLIQNYL